MTSKRVSTRRILSSQANTRSMVRKRSLKMAALNMRLGPRLVVFLARGFSLMLGTMPRLKIAFRFTLLAAFARNPFSGAPPRFIRVIRFEYRFTDAAERARNGHWWRRTPLDYYVEPISLH